MLTYLRDKIRNSPQQWISFAEYMQECLYHPQYGYYMRDQQKIGKQGDYYTSSSVHPVFAETVVDVAVDAWQKSKVESYHFVEMGAGTGLFAKQFLDYMQVRFPEVYTKVTYLILEKSSYHRERQKEALANHPEQLVWLEQLQDRKLASPILFSNELVDAFPVHLVQQRRGTLEEVVVAWSEERQGCLEQYIPLQNEQIVEYLELAGLVLEDGSRLEIPVQATEWAKEVSYVLEEGLWLTIDYGYTNEELQLPAHRQGSLVCYYQHQVDENPLEQPGEKDITYHIHFDQLRAVAEKAGWQTLAYLSQAEFLLRAGILNKLENQAGGDPFRHPALKKNRAIRQFITPDGISTYFHVLLLAKGNYEQSEYTFLQK